MTWDIILGVIWGLSVNAAYVLGYLSALRGDRRRRISHSETPPECEGVSGLSSRQDVSPFLHG